MPSNAFIHYMVVQIPDVLRKYLKKRFNLTDDLCDMYINLLQCLIRSTYTRGGWRTQLNILVIGAMEELFRVWDLEDVLAFDFQIPREYQRDRWLPNGD